MRHSTCDIVYAGKELKQGSSRKIVAFFFVVNSGKRFGGLLWKEFIHNYRYRNRQRKRYEGTTEPKKRQRESEKKTPGEI